METRVLNGEVVQVSDEELAEIQAERLANEDRLRKEHLKKEAIELLIKSDLTIIRCVENTITVPNEWVSYREALRDILNTGEGIIPDRPPYPQ